MKVQRYRRKLFLTTVKSMSKQQNCPGKRDEIFSYKHKRNSSRLPGCLAGPVYMEAGLARLRDSPVSEISLGSYFYSKNYRAVIWTSGLARLPRSRLKEARSRLPGWKFLHINTPRHKRASPVAGMEVQRYRRKLFLTTVKTIQCNKIVPAS
jgi:hypothetical protein